MNDLHSIEFILLSFSPSFLSFFFDSLTWTSYDVKVLKMENNKDVDGINCAIADWLEWDHNHRHTFDFGSVGVFALCFRVLFALLVLMVVVWFSFRFVPVWILDWGKSFKAEEEEEEKKVN